MRGAWPVHPFFLEDNVRHHQSAVNLGGKKQYLLAIFFFFLNHLMGSICSAPFELVPRNEND